MGMTWETVKQVVRAVVGTAQDELSCDECMDQLDRFVEMELAGRDAAAAFPSVASHLAICRDCQEEHLGMLAAVRAFA